MDACALSVSGCMCVCECVCVNAIGVCVCVCVRARAHACVWFEVGEFILCMLSLLHAASLLLVL